MNREQLERQIKAHEDSAARYWNKAALYSDPMNAQRLHYEQKAHEHEVAIAQYREQYDMPEPTTFGRPEHHGRQRAERDKQEAKFRSFKHR